MEATLKRELTYSAEVMGLPLSDPKFEKAVETGCVALEDGYSFDVALEVARSVLRPQLALV